MIAVSAGMVLNKGRILLCKRKPGGECGLKWEFPGGKLEPGERPEEALVRELREELAIGTRVTGYFTSRRTDTGKDILLLFLFAELVSGTPVPIECEQAEWVEPARLLDYDLAPSDRSVAEEYLRFLNISPDK